MITFSVATSDVAVAALVTDPSVLRSAARPSTANRSRHRALGPNNGAAHVRSISRRRTATTGAPSPQLRRLHYRHSAPQLRGFVQSGFYEVARYNRAGGSRLPRDLTEPSRFLANSICDSLA